LLGKEAKAMEMHVKSRQVVSFLLSGCAGLAVCGSVLFSLHEEEKSGTLVANVLKDLKLEVKEWSARNARLVSKSSSKQYFQLGPSSRNGMLKDRVDRETLCVQKDPCVLPAEIVLENPLQLHRIEVEIEDVNHNSPKFSKKRITLEISELVPV
ncbi:hypothetical protein JRQ81_010745, partial [Phrynocephalus forsythii]